MRNLLGFGVLTQTLAFQGHDKLDANVPLWQSVSRRPTQCMSNLVVLEYYLLW